MGLDMHKMAKLGLLLLALLVSKGAEANGVPPISLGNQLDRADLVVVGRLGRQTFCVVGNRRLPCAEMITEAVLKGSATASGTQRYIILNFGVMEMSIEHVNISARALFFLSQMRLQHDSVGTSIEYYRPVSGPQSVLPFKESTA